MTALIRHFHRQQTKTESAAKKANEYFNRLDGGEGNIIYSKEKIRKKEVTP